MGVNRRCVLVMGKTATGKSACFRNIKNPEGVMYLNAESGKELPFPANFMKAPSGEVGITITDPLQVFECFQHAETLPEIHTIILDSVTFLMDMFETQYVLTAVNTMQAWGEYNQFFKRLMAEYVAKSTKNVIFTAHTLSTYNENEMEMETRVPVKGALKNQGIEAYFTTAIATKKVDLSELRDKKQESDMLTITDDDEIVGYKYCFQTRITKETRNDTIRGPMGLFAGNETFVDNDIQRVIEHMEKYYHLDSLQ